MKIKVKSIVDDLDNYDHILARHFGQNKTLELVRYRYSWPSLCADVQ